MNYSKNLRKKAIARRVIILCAIVAVFFALIGGCVGYALKGHVASESRSDTPYENCRYACMDEH